MVTATHAKKSTRARWRKTLIRERQFWIIAAVAVCWLALFKYYPMYGLVISFFKYIPGTSFVAGEFVGLRYFQQFFESPEFPNVMRNTLAISGLNLLFCFPAPILFSVLLNEVRMKFFKRTVQTVSYLPHFVSWVVVASFAFSLMGNEGLINEVMMRLGFIDRPVTFLGKGEYFWPIITILNIWKSLGWSSIIYISAMAGVDTELYQAGAVDGLGRTGMVWHVTLPSIMPTIMVMFILQIGSMLDAGFEQQLLIGNDMTRGFHEVIDTYAYRYGMQLGRYSFATAVGLFKSVISVVLVFGTNALSKKLTDSSLI